MTLDKPPVMPPKQYKISEQESALLSKLNSTIDGMKSFTPTDPYILTVPQDVQQRYHYQFQYQTQQWLAHTPFHHREDQLVQYQTWYYHEHGKEPYELMTNVQLEERAGLRRAGRPTLVNVSTSGDGQPKKKISLAAYKGRKEGGTREGTPAMDIVKLAKEAKTEEKLAEKMEEKEKVKQTAMKGPIERIKADADLPEIPDMLEEIQQEQSIVLKRKREDSPTKPVETKERIKVNADSHADTSEPEPPGKKQKREKSPTPPPVKQEEFQEKATSPLRQVSPPKRSQSPSLAEQEASMPRKLSPLAAEHKRSDKQPSQQPKAALLPPPRLSSNMPSNITASIESRKRPNSQRSLSRSAPPSASKENQSANHIVLKVTPTKSLAAAVQHSSGEVKKMSPTPRNGFRTGSPALSAVNRDEDPPRSTPTHAQDQERPAQSEPAAKTEPERRSLIISLKIKTVFKHRVRDILRLRSQPKATKEPSRPERRNTRDASAKGVAQRIGPVGTNGVSKRGKRERDVETEVAEQKSLEPPPKRARAEQQTYQPPGKRKQAPANLKLENEPATPVQRDFQSPSLLSSAPKSQQVTPTNTRKDLLSVAMQRDRSSDSSANTPTAQNRTPALVNGSHTSQPNGVGKPSPPSNKTVMQSAWEVEQKRLEGLGRELKHAAQDHLKAISSNSQQSQLNAVPPNDARLAAIKSIECLLCYILAFTCSDASLPVADPKLHAKIAPWKSLHGFFSFVQKCCEPFPHLLGLACTLGVVFNARILAIVTQHPSEMPNREVLLEVTAALQRAASEAKLKLPLQVMSKHFPSTWSKGLLSSPPVGHFKPGRYAGEFQLPVGIETGSLHGVRAGLSLLEEWCQREEAGHEIKLKL